MNHSKPTPSKAKHEVYEPWQLHSHLDELRHLVNCAYFTLSDAKGNTTRVESSAYVVCLVASKLDDLAFHYECILEEEKSEAQQALELFKQLTPEGQQKTLTEMREMLGGAA